MAWRNGDLLTPANLNNKGFGTPFFNVKDALYGATGDNSTNDTAAVQAAITACIAAGGGIVFFPDGTFRVTGVTVANSAAVTLRGCGYNVSTLKLHSGTGHLIELTGSCGLQVYDLHLTDNGLITGRTDRSVIRCDSADLVGPFIVERCKISQCSQGIWLDDPDQETPGDVKTPITLAIRDCRFEWSKVAAEIGYCISLVGYSSSVKIENNTFYRCSTRNTVRIYVYWETGVADGRDNGLAEICGNQFIECGPYNFSVDSTGIYYKGSHSKIHGNRFYEHIGRCLDIQGTDSSDLTSLSHSVMFNRCMWKSTGSVVDLCDFEGAIVFRCGDGVAAYNHIDTGSGTVNRIHGIISKWGTNKIDISHNWIRSSGSCIYVRGVTDTGVGNSDAAQVLISHNRLDSYRSTTDACIWFEGGDDVDGTDVNNVRIVFNKGDGFRGVKFGQSSVDRDYRIRNVTILQNDWSDCSQAYDFSSFPYFYEVDDIGTPTFTCDTAGDGDHEALTLSDALDRLPKIFHGLNSSTITLDVKGSHGAATKFFCYDGALSFTDSATGAKVTGALQLVNTGRGLVTLTGIDGDTSAAVSNTRAFRLDTGRFEVASCTVTAGGTNGITGIEARLGATVHLNSVTINNALNEAVSVQTRSLCVVTSLAGSGNAERFDVSGGSGVRVISSTLTTATDTVGTGSIVFQELSGSATWNPGNLADGAGETSASITVTGAVLGDFVLASAPYDLQGITMTPYVDASNSVKIRLQNETGGAIDLASGTWKVRVIK